MPRQPRTDDGRGAGLRPLLPRIAACARSLFIGMAAVVAAATLAITLLAPAAAAQFVQGGSLVQGPSSSNFSLWGTIASPVSGVFKADDGFDFATGGNSGANFARIWIALGTQLGGNTAVSASDTIQYVYIRIDHKGVIEESTNFNMQLNLGGAPSGRVDHLLTLRPIFSGPNKPISGRIRIALKRYSTDAQGNYPLLGAFTTSSFVNGSDIDNVGAPAEGTAIGWEGVATDTRNGFEARIPAGWFHGDATRLVQPDGSGASSVVAALFTSGGSFGAVATVLDKFADVNGNNVLLKVSTSSGSHATVTGTQLAFVTQPVATSAFTTLAALTVKQQNADGTTVVGGTASVALAIASGPAGGTISGTTTRTASSGTATFNDVSFSVPGTYTLTATSYGLLSATSVSFAISATTAPAPTITSIAAGDAQLSVAFTAPANDGGSAITTYQFSTNNGTSWSPRATGTTASPLVITGLANGTTYTVRVRAVSAIGNGAQSNSATGTPSAPSPPSSTVAPAITGTTTLGQTLTASTGTWTGSPAPTYAYQWERCDAAGANCAALSGATSNTSALVSADVGATRRVVVTATNASASATATSSQSAVVAEAPVNTVAPVISGTAISGQLLTTTDGSWTGTPAPAYGYQWRRCDASGTNCTNLAGATSSSYTLVDADAGATVRVAVTGTNSAGSATATAAPTVTVTGPPASPANVAAPTISGTTAVGQQLTAASGSWTGNPAATFTLQWQRCGASGNSCTNITGETASTYTLVSADAGSTIRVVVTGSNASGSATGRSIETAAIVSPPVNIAPPTIGGTATVGQLLAAVVGTWTGTPVPTLSHQWQRCDASGANCADIGGATASTYTLASADAGATIRFVETGANSAGSALAMSAGSAAVAAALAVPVNTVAPSIAGTSAAGQLLSASTGTWAGFPIPTYTFQWSRCDASGNNCTIITGETSATYTLVNLDAGTTIRVVVTGTNAAGAATATSAQSPIVGASAAPASAPANTATPVIGGVTVVGQLLTTTSGSWAGNPAPTLSHQWQRCDAAGANCTDISSATLASYTLTSGDANRTMRVRVTGTSTSGTATAISAQSAVVRTVPAPVIPTAPAIAGAPQVGQPLTADPGLWTAPDPVTFQWQRCDASGSNCVSIGGATQPGYTPGDEDGGAVLRVLVTSTASGKTQMAAIGPIAIARAVTDSRVIATPARDPAKTGMAPADSVPADGTRFALVRIELVDATNRPITRRTPSDFAITIDGVAVAATVRETSTAGVYEFEVRSTKVNQVTVGVRIDGVLLTSRPTVNFVTATANLDIKLAASTETPTVGQTVVFTVDVTNVGPDAATGVEVEHRLVDRVRFVSSEATRGSYDATRGVWTIGSLALGESATMKVTVTVIK